MDLLHQLRASTCPKQIIWKDDFFNFFLIFLSFFFEIGLEFIPSDYLKRIKIRLNKFWAKSSSPKAEKCQEQDSSETPFLLDFPFWCEEHQAILKFVHLSRAKEYQP